MPNIKSAKKRVKISKVEALRNKSVRSNLKTVLKKAELAIVGNTADKDEAVKLAVKTIDRASAKGVIHSNNASRKKSSIIRKANKAV